MGSNQCKLFYEIETKEIVEVAVSENGMRLHRRMEGDKLSDGINDVEYEIGVPSDFYIIWALREIFEEYDSENMEILSLLRRGLLMRFNRIQRERISENETTIMELLKIMVRFQTLKISKVDTSKIDLDGAVDSYSYTYMRNLQEPIKIYNIDDIFPFLTNKRIEQRFDFEAPKKYYNSTLVDYYNLAVSSTDPFVEFISYYHIIEYYYDEVFKEHQIESVKKAITSPTFNYKDETKIFSIVQTIIKDNKMVRENGGGNEQQSLNYVLNKYLDDIEEFKGRFTQNRLDYYQNNNVVFSKGDKINWSNGQEKVIKSIGNRIYKTRNSLIHSKSSKKDETYHPYEDRKHLAHEIQLIKNIAETIIEYNSKYI